MAKRIHRKVERTAEEQARLQQIREQFQQEKPSLADLVASGEYNEPIPHGEYVLIRQLAVALKQAREAAGLSLAEVEARSEIDKAALSRLETGQQINPTLNTLVRYARALGKKWVWALEDAGGGEPGHSANEEDTVQIQEVEAVAESLVNAIQASPRLRHLVVQGLRQPATTNRETRE